MNIQSEQFQSFENSLKMQSLVGDHPFFDKTLFPWVNSLEKNHKEIFEEYSAFNQKISVDKLVNFQDISEDQKAITNDD